MTAYKDYHYHVKWSSEDAVYIGGVDEFPSLHAHGNTPEQALGEIRIVTALAIADMREKGEHVPPPLS